MGIGYRINEDLGLTVVVWDGKVTDEDCRRHFVTLAEDTRWPRTPAGRRALAKSPTSPR